ncbi:MAG: hypothetical protein ABL927_04950 [Bdellovibrionales bacterium]
MNFDKFLNIPSNEFELFMKLAQNALMSFKEFHGQNFYIHLKDCGDGKHSLIDETRAFTDLYKFGHYAYIDRDREACIFFRSDKNSIAMLLYGERDSGELIINESGITVLYGPNKSTLPGARRCKLTALEMMEAFGQIEQSLQKTKRHKVS